mmetsp:Transcript_49772/g.117005  ORF Transcript_49772/g.117005 Transcript_49772/m.117005 type:complete len:84 (-) Transcript_49772:603-854(-)
MWHYDTQLGLVLKQEVRAYDNRPERPKEQKPVKLKASRTELPAVKPAKEVLKELRGPTYSKAMVDPVNPAPLLPTRDQTRVLP